MLTPKIRSAALSLFVMTGLCACVSINSITPEPAVPGELVRLHLSNIIGPTSGEPGARVTFNGEPMMLDPDTAWVVGFEVPEGTPEGTYTVEVSDGVGVLEVITIVPLFRKRSDSASLIVGPP